MSYRDEARKAVEQLRKRASLHRETAANLENDAAALEEDAATAIEIPERPGDALSVQAAAKALDVSPESIRRWLKEGKLGGFQLPGGSWRVRADAIDELKRNAAPDPGVIDPHASRSRLVAVQGSLRERATA